MSGSEASAAFPALPLSRHLKFRVSSFSAWQAADKTAPQGASLKKSELTCRCFCASAGQLLRGHSKALSQRGATS